MIIPLVKLHRSPDRDSVYINVWEIAFLLESEQPNTHVRTRSGHDFYVVERPEEILELLTADIDLV